MTPRRTIQLSSRQLSMLVALSLLAVIFLLAFILTRIAVAIWPHSVLAVFAGPAFLGVVYFLMRRAPGLLHSWRILICGLLGRFGYEVEHVDDQRA